jgi:hypothetical protein
MGGGDARRATANRGRGSDVASDIAGNKKPRVGGVF